MSAAEDLERAVTNAWEDLADAEGERDLVHAAHAVEDLVRLRQISLEHTTHFLQT